jgi:hypothetical protein
MIWGNRAANCMSHCTNSLIPRIVTAYQNFRGKVLCLSRSCIHVPCFYAYLVLVGRDTDHATSGRCSTTVPRHVRLASERMMSKDMKQWSMVVHLWRPSCRARVRAALPCTYVSHAHLHTNFEMFFRFQIGTQFFLKKR